ncbi:uncharacterized protein LOC111518591 isoform X2 [Drosophila willistoni]|uniref:uncharacterized protein LOC111518591 isoform X2 n=1 Tax=Drosophila willistoni TaxID=7260 RepID=UPI001F07441D|nr:uncharacterized protein LOC111518591 isoform X2 [Drosophila willistoni]
MTDNGISKQKGHFPTINSEELLQVAKMKSIRKLKCGFSSSHNIETLAQLMELQELTITTHKSRSLEGLFKKFSSRTSSALQYLAIRNNEITIDELKAIAGIKSLKRLKCAFTNPKDDVVLPEMLNLEELCIIAHRSGKLSKKLRLFSKCSLNKIIIMGDSLDVQDVAALSEFESLKILHIHILQLDCINLLLPIKNLAEIKIDLKCHGCDIKSPIRLSENLGKLYKLALKLVIINNEDFSNCLQLPALKSLECRPALTFNTNFEGLAQLEELIIASLEFPNDSIYILLQALVEKTPKNLKRFVIKNENLDMESSLLLSQIDSITTLECGFESHQSIHLLKKLINLQSLKITSKHSYIATWDAFFTLVKNCPKLESLYLQEFEEFNWKPMIYSTL